MTPDPYSNSGRLNDPQSWNRYAYTRGDAVNRFDPKGTDVYFYSSGGTTVTSQGTGTETLNNAADGLFGPYAVFNDSPGPQFAPNGLNTGTWQTVDCPPLTWLSMIWGSRQNNQLTYGGQATVIP